MKCKNLGNKCNYEEKLKPVEGQGSFKGYDVFQCPKCKEVATTVKKSIKKADIKKGLPEGISPSSNPRTKAQMISENNSDEFRDYAKRENINPKESCPSCGIKATEGNEVAGFTCPNCDQQPKHHPSNFAYEDLGDNTGLPSRINKFVSKSEKNIFGDASKQEEKEVFVEGDPDKINYLGFEKHGKKEGKVSKSIKKAMPLYSIKKDNPDPDAAYDEMRERRPIRKPARNVGLTNKYENVKGGDNYAVEPDWDAMKDDVDIEKLKRPSKAAGAAIGGALGAMTPLGPLGAAGGAYLGHKLGKSSQGQKSVGGKKIKRLRAGHASSGPKVPMGVQASHVKKAVPGWEVPTYNICPECKQDRPGDENVMRGMKCAACSGMGGVPELCGRIGNFVDKGRDFQTKGERREQNKRPRMPMSGRNTGEVYRNAVKKRAPTYTKPLHKIPNIEKAGAPILPCKSCGKQVPHFKSSPATTQGLCSECIRTSLTKPKPISKAMWTNQKVCINPQCGWKKGYTKNDPRHATVQQSKSCPQCTKVTRDVPFSPDF